MNTAERQQQIAQAEEILGDRLGQAGFAKGLFFGQYLDQRLPRYPDLAGDSQLDQRVEELRQFCREHVDPVAIDRDSQIPRIRYP